jgi:chromosome segregation ATPase
MEAMTDKLLTTDEIDELAERTPNTLNPIEYSCLIAAARAWVDEQQMIADYDAGNKAENDAFNAASVDLRSEVERWKAIAQAHNDSLVERIAENERLAEQVADYDEQITSLYLERARLEAENERLKQACDGYLEHAAGLRVENERLTVRAEKAEAYMDQFAAESNRLREALKEIMILDRFADPGEPWQYGNFASIARAALRVEESALSAESAT